MKYTLTVILILWGCVAFGFGPADRGQTCVDIIEDAPRTIKLRARTCVFCGRYGLQWRVTYFKDGGGVGQSQVMVYDKEKKAVVPRTCKVK